MNFEEFAYFPHEIEYGDAVDPEVLPLPPWENYDTFPNIGLNEAWLLNARAIKGETELIFFHSGKIKFYNVSTRKVYSIENEIQNSKMFVSQIFIMPDGSVWGAVEWKDYYHYDARNIYVLSRLNEETQRFEFDKNSMKLQIQTGAINFTKYRQILLDSEGVFWIVIPNDGIYSYNPAIGITRKKANIPSLDVFESKLGPDNKIYLHVLTWKTGIEQGAYFVFSPETNSIVDLPLPSERWPNTGGIHVDHEGQVWLGAIGVRDKAGEWRLLHPNIEEVFENFGNPDSFRWQSPRIIYESSNGLLWFEKHYPSGLAWYDPKTGKGCNFTNFGFPIRMIEDPEKNMWIITEDKLYRYALEKL